MVRRRPDLRLRFGGRVAVVTGAAGGIGSAIAERLAAEGATVWVCDVSVDGAAAVATQIGGRPLTFDLADAEACTAAIDTVVEQSGRVQDPGVCSRPGDVVQGEAPVEVGRARQLREGVGGSAGEAPSPEAEAVLTGVAHTFSLRV